MIRGIIVEVAGARQIQDDVNWSIQLSIANAGESEAHVTEGNLTITKTTPFTDGFVEIMPTFPPYSEQRDSLGNFAIEPGEHHERSVRLDSDTTTRFRILGHVRAGGGGAAQNVYFLGFLQYRDKINISRRTAFCFRYDVKSARFERVDNPDFNYAD